jgi:Icc-related predicted phosphoesterase
VWAKIPNGVDVLVTHGPPFGVLDRTTTDELVGCEELLMAVERAQPRLHVFGHIHEGAGALVQGRTLFVNASVCTVGYDPDNPIRVVDVPLDRAAPATLANG